MEKTTIYYEGKTWESLSHSLLSIFPITECRPEVIGLENIDVCTHFRPNSILVATHTKTLKFVSAMERRGYKYGLFAMGDENLEDNLAYVNNANCHFVAAEYFNPEAYSLAEKLGNQSKLIFTRLRCNNQFFSLANSSQKKAKRSISWFFAGDINSSGRGNNRKFAIEEFNKIDGGQWWDTEQGFHEDHKKETALCTKDYFQRLSDSYFSLCPVGWTNIDTYRFYEALDAGCIPIVLRSPSGFYYQPELPSYWSLKFAIHDAHLPFIVAKSWKEARAEVSKIITSGQIHVVQRATWLFWEELQAKWYSQLKFLHSNLRKSTTDYRVLAKSIAQSPL